MKFQITVELKFFVDLYHLITDILEQKNCCLAGPGSCSVLRLALLMLDGSGSRQLHRTLSIRVKNQTEIDDILLHLADLRNFLVQALSSSLCNHLSLLLILGQKSPSFYNFVYLTS